MKKGLLVVLTGNTENQAVWAVGQVFRALGRGLKVSVIEFVEGWWNGGESILAKCFGELLEVHSIGNGLSAKSNESEPYTKAAQEAWRLAKEAISSGKFDVVVLNEPMYLLRYSLVEPNELVELLSSRPSHVHVVVTGRYAPESLIEVADIVTEMKDMKEAGT